MSVRSPTVAGHERLMRRSDTSPAAGIRSGEPFMVVRGVILTAQTARGPDLTVIHKKDVGEMSENSHQLK